MKIGVRSAIKDRWLDAYQAHWKKGCDLSCLVFVSIMASSMLPDCRLVKISAERSSTEKMFVRMILHTEKNGINKKPHTSGLSLK